MMEMLLLIQAKLEAGSLGLFCWMNELNNKRNVQKVYTPPREKQSLPHPTEMDKTCGARRGIADC